MIVAASAGAACGDQIGFLLGRRYGNRLVDHLPAMVRRSGELDRAFDLIRRRGAVAVALGRWAAVLRALVPGAAGTSGMAQARFTVSNVIGGTIWAVVISVAGYLVGASYKSLSSNLGIAGDVIAATVVLLTVVWWIRARRHRSGEPTGRLHGG